MTLQPVKLLKHDSCYTYALKRIGAFNILTVSMTAEEFIKRCDVSGDINNLVSGDLLLMKNNKDTDFYELSNYISSEGKVEWNDIKTNLHFMVYEGEGRISEAVNAVEALCEIQVRKLSTISTDKYVKLVIPDNFYNF